MNNHSSYVIMNVITFCMQNITNLFIMPPHCLHLFQPFNVSIFAPLKYVLNKKKYILN